MAVRQVPSRVSETQVAKAIPLRQQPRQEAALHRLARLKVVAPTVGHIRLARRSPAGRIALRLRRKIAKQAARQVAVRLVRPDANARLGPVAETLQVRP